MTRIGIQDQSIRIGNTTFSNQHETLELPKAVCTVNCSLHSWLMAGNYSSNHMIKFAHDTIDMSLISSNDELAYREDVE